MSSGSAQSMSEDPLERKMHVRQMRMTMKSQSLINKQLQKLSKKMGYFENTRENEGLMIKDFQRIQ